MNKIVVGLIIGVFTTGGLLAVTAARHVPTVRPNVTVAGVPMGGLTLQEAEKALRVWWEEEKQKPLKLHSDKLKFELPDTRPGLLGVTIDDVATAEALPMQDTLTDLQASVNHPSYSELKVTPIFKSNGQPPTELMALIQKNVGVPRPARVFYSKTGIERYPEVSTESLDVDSLMPAVVTALKEGVPVELPVTEAAKHLPDDQLATITDVVSEFSTHFPKRQYNRNQNIRLASGRLNGVILLPGEQLSFNKTVGQRTEKQGFMLAGVYKNGKHDTGIGGGICQVSTTLYNASLYGNLKIVRRSNHSMPVAYVPLGRDATVDWGSLDLVIENSYSTPIAVTSEYQPGTLTFRILGKKVPGQWVKILQVGGKSWDRSVQIIHDAHLRPGTRMLVEKGTRGHSITTYRLVYKDGVVISKKSLGQSYYGGGDRIIAVGPPATMPAPLSSGVGAANPPIRLTGG